MTRPQWSHRFNPGYHPTWHWAGYTLRWIGSSHGVWTVEYAGARIAVVGLLKDAKRTALEHHDQRIAQLDTTTGSDAR